MRQTGPRQVLYVSCHPATLARDLNVLCAGNVFEVKKIVPLDMFPQTQHAECVADARFGGPPAGADKPCQQGAVSSKLNHLL